MSCAPAIQFEEVTFAYQESAPVLDGLTFTVEAGEMIALMGDNGCGKSTVARLMDALLFPDSGRVSIFGSDTRHPGNTVTIRQECALVFQNPDDQMVATLVHDEVAFGPRNLGLSPDEVTARVKEALRAVRMQDHWESNVNALSGGQKQRVAIAGALAMHPRILILDEATSMLDSTATEEIMEALLRLKETGVTIVLITHDAQVASYADRTIHLSSSYMDQPSLHSAFPRHPALVDVPLAIQFDHVTFTYEQGVHPVLQDISFVIPEGAFCIVTGPNGSGKSTMLMHMNGLLQPQSGCIRLFNEPISTNKDRDRARFTCGLVFQYPERQLFESTVFDDVAFGPRNLGLSPDEVHTRVEEALLMLGLADESIQDRNPYELSGGQQRKVALAGVLAMRPRILALDEPCAGLDPFARVGLLELLARLNDEGTTIIMVTHDDTAACFPGCQIIETGQARQDAVS